MKSGDTYVDNLGRLWVLQDPEADPITLESYYGLHKDRVIAAADFLGAVATGFYTPFEVHHTTETREA